MSGGKIVRKPENNTSCRCIYKIINKKICYDIHIEFNILFTISCLYIIFPIGKGIFLNVGAWSEVKFHEDTMILKSQFNIIIMVKFYYNICGSLSIFIWCPAASFECGDAQSSSQNYAYWGSNCERGRLKIRVANRPIKDARRASWKLCACSFMVLYGQSDWMWFMAVYWWAIVWDLQPDIVISGPRIETATSTKHQLQM